MEKVISRLGNSDLEIDCILQARMGSKRLPGKVLLEIDDSQKIIDFIIKLLENTKINELVIAIPDNQEDDILYNHLENLKINPPWKNWNSTNRIRNLILLTAH